MKAFRKSGRQEAALCAAFFEAVSAGDMETVQKMLDLGVPVNSTNASGQTALFLCRDRPVAELLLDRGAEVGEITGMEPIPGNLCLYVGDKLVPLHEDFVISCDPEARVLDLDLPEGLLDS